jgi:hypothetical protein
MDMASGQSPQSLGDRSITIFQFLTLMMWGLGKRVGVGLIVARSRCPLGENCVSMGGREGDGEGYGVSRVEKLSFSLEGGDGSYCILHPAHAMMIMLTKNGKSRLMIFLIAERNSSELYDRFADMDIDLYASVFRDVGLHQMLLQTKSIAI